MKTTLLGIFLLIFGSSYGQLFDFSSNDSLFNVDMWTHVSRKQLPKHITQAEKDSLYYSQIKKFDKNHITVHLMYFGKSIDKDTVECKFKDNQIIIKKKTEIRGRIFFWGRTTLKRRIYFNNYCSIRYRSKSRARKFKFLIWPAERQKQDVDRIFEFYKPYGW